MTHKFISTLQNKPSQLALTSYRDDLPHSELREYRMPADGSCLFWSVAIGVLEPVLNNENTFRDVFNMMFKTRNHNEKSDDNLFDTYGSLIKECICNYIRTGNPDILKRDDTLYNLINHSFRQNVATYIYDNRQNFISYFESGESGNQFDLLDFHVVNLRKNDTWGGEIEIAAIYEMLGIQIQLGNRRYERPDAQTIHLNYTSADGVSNVNNHYNVLLRQTSQTSSLSYISSSKQFPTLLDKNGKSEAFRTTHSDLSTKLETIQTDDAFIIAISHALRTLYNQNQLSGPSFQEILNISLFQQPTENNKSPEEKLIDITNKIIQECPKTDPFRKLLKTYLKIYKTIVSKMSDADKSEIDATFINLVRKLLAKKEYFNRPNEQQDALEYAFQLNFGTLYSDPDLIKTGTEHRVLALRILYKLNTQNAISHRDQEYFQTIKTELIAILIRDIHRLRENKEKNDDNIMQSYTNAISKEDIDTLIQATQFIMNHVPDSKFAFYLKNIEASDISTELDRTTGPQGLLFRDELISRLHATCVNPPFHQPLKVQLQNNNYAIQSKKQLNTLLDKIFIQFKESAAIISRSNNQPVLAPHERLTVTSSGVFRKSYKTTADQIIKDINQFKAQLTNAKKDKKANKNLIDALHIVIQEYQQFLNLWNATLPKEPSTHQRQNNLPLIETKEDYEKQHRLKNKTNISIHDNNFVNHLVPSELSDIITERVNSQGLIVQSSERTGAHTTILYKGVFFKFTPLHEEIQDMVSGFMPSFPGIEFAVDSINKQLTGNVSPASHLFKITANGYPFGVVASKEIKGDTLHNRLKTNPNLRVSSLSFSSQLLMNIIVCAGDGKSDNYIIQKNKRGEDEIISIDNDVAFAPPIVRVGDHHTVGILSTLYFMDQMDDAIDPQLINRLRDLDINDIILTWITELTEQNRHYDQLLTNGTFTESEYTSLNLPIRLQPGTISSLHQRLDSIKKLVTENNTPTHWDMLSAALPIDVYRYYRGVKEKMKTEAQKSNIPFNPDTAANTINECRSDQSANPSFTMESILTKFTPSTQDYSDTFIKKTQSIQDAASEWLDLIELDAFDDSIQSDILNRFIQLGSPNLRIKNSTALKSLETLRFIYKHLNLRLESIQLSNCPNITGNHIFSIIETFPTTDIIIIGDTGISNDAFQLLKQHKSDIQRYPSEDHYKLVTKMANINCESIKKLLKQNHEATDQTTIRQVIIDISNPLFKETYDMVRRTVGQSHELTNALQNVGYLWASMEPSTYNRVNQNPEVSQERRALAMYKLALDISPPKSPFDRNALINQLLEHNLLSESLIEYYFDARIDDLDLSHCTNLTDDHLRAIFERCPHIRSLNLSNCQRITDQSIALAASTLRNLQHINLTRCISLTSEGLNSLALTESLRTIQFNGRIDSPSELTDDHLRNILQSNRNLTELNLYMCQNLTDSAISEIATYAQNLERLSIIRCDNLTELSLTWLAQIRSLVELNHTIGEQP